jgi:outer membrane protein
MKTKFSILLLIICIGESYAQDKTKSANSFSLQDAINYSVAHNPNHLNTIIDAEIAKARKNEITGIGLPQLNGSFDMRYNPKVPTQVLPNFIGSAILQTLQAAGLYPPGPLPPPNPEFIAAQFGVKYNANLGITASQLIFSSDYIVGLQAAKAIMELSQKNIDRSKIDIIAQVSKAYFGVIINKERIKLIDANIARVKKLRDDTKVLFDNGFVEKIDLDRIDLAFNNILVEKEKITRLFSLAESLLKFQMGLDLNQGIVLTDSLSVSGALLTDINDKINVSNRIEYSLIKQQELLNQFDLKRNKLSYLPTLAGYGTMQTQAMRNEFDVFNSKTPWYAFGSIGLTLNLNLFDGLQKNYRIQQSKLNLEKTQNSLKNIENALTLETQSAQVNYQNAISSINFQKKNIELAENVYKVSKIKYDQGVGSNLEVLNAETSLKEAQTNYYNALYDYVVSKVDYDKAIGNLK